MKYLLNHSEISPLSEELILIPCYLRGVNQIGESLQYPVYRGKNSLVLRSEYEVLKKKNT